MNDAEIRALPAPPPEELARLLELAEEGHVSGVLNELARLAEADPLLGAWIGQVRAVAQSFQTQRLRALLRAQVDTASQQLP
jgi:hypothetical protein